MRTASTAPRAAEHADADEEDDSSGLANAPGGHRVAKADRRPPEVDPLFQSLDHALRFYFLWLGRLTSPRCVMPSSPEEMALRFVQGPAPRAESIRATMADISKCLEVLDEEELTCLAATYGIAAGRLGAPDGRGVPRIVLPSGQVRNGLWVDGKAVYVDESTGELVNELLAKGLGPPARGKRGPTASMLSYVGVARALGWRSSGGGWNKGRVQKVVHTARRKVRGMMRNLGVLPRGGFEPRRS